MYDISCKTNTVCMTLCRLPCLLPEDPSFALPGNKDGENFTPSEKEDAMGEILRH